MRKSLIQWKIFFDSMNSKKSNLICFSLMMFNVMLYIFLAGMNITKGKGSFYYILSCFWLISGFLYFLRLFYNQTSVRFSKTLPCTKKLYTKYLSISFQAVNFTAVIEWLILWLIFGALGNDVSKFNCIFLIICIFHLLISVGIPFTSIILSQEKQITNIKSHEQMGTALKLIICMFFIGCNLFGLHGLLYKYLMNINKANFLCGIGFVFICISILIISCVLNRIIFNKMYRH